MKRFVLCLFLVFALVAPAAAECPGCKAAAEARERTVTGYGSPEADAVCFRVLMTDLNDSVAVTISYGDNRKSIITFPKGAAVRMAGEEAVRRGELPMVCIPAPELKGATKVVAIPGSKEGCAILHEQHIAQLLKERDIPNKQPACLLKSHADCDKIRPKG